MENSYEGFLQNMATMLRQAKRYAVLERDFTNLQNKNLTLVEDYMKLDGKLAEAEKEHQRAWREREIAVAQAQQEMEEKLRTAQTERDVAQAALLRVEQELAAMKKKIHSLTEAVDAGAAASSQAAQK